jgi:drug/metabolite transporter (DMT)-like permease
MTFAWFSLRVRTWGRDIGSLSLTAATAWAGLFSVMLPAYLIWLLFGGVPFAYQAGDLPNALSAMAFVALGPTLMGNVGYLYGVTVLGPHRAAAFIYLSPVFSAILSVALLGEVLQPFHLVGFVMIIAGLLLVSFDQRQVARSGT